MNTERTRFRVSDTYQEIRWSTPIGCVEFKIEFDVFPFRYIYAVINDEANYQLFYLDCVENRKILIREINAMIKSNLIYGSPLKSNTDKKGR